MYVLFDLLLCSRACVISCLLACVVLTFFIVRLAFCVCDFFLACVIVWLLSYVIFLSHVCLLKWVMSFANAIACLILRLRLIGLI